MGKYGVAVSPERRFYFLNGAHFPAALRFAVRRLSGFPGFGIKDPAADAKPHSKQAIISAAKNRLHVLYHHLPLYYFYIVLVLLDKNV